MTLAYWLGGAFGCAAADPHRAASIPPTQTTQTQTQLTGPAQIYDTLLLAEPSTSPAPTKSLRGIDRSHWPRTTVASVDSSTDQYPTYFHDLQIKRAPTTDTHNLNGLIDLGVIQLPANDFLRVNQQVMATESALLAALQNGASAGSWNAPNAKAFIAQPAKFAFDLISLPVNLVRYPIWKPLPPSR